VPLCEPKIRKGVFYVKGIFGGDTYEFNEAIVSGISYPQIAFKRTAALNILSAVTLGSSRG
jgi:hypothetical protein